MLDLEYKILQIMPAAGHVAVFYRYNTCGLGNIYTDPVICWSLCECLNEKKTVDSPNTTLVRGMYITDGFVTSCEDSHTFLGYCRENDFNTDDWIDMARSYYTIWHRSLGENSQ